LFAAYATDQIIQTLRRKKFREGISLVVVTGVLFFSFLEIRGLRQIRPDDFNNVAVAWQKKGNIEKSNEVLNRALMLYPEDATVNFNKGEYYFHKQKWERAIEHFEKALALGLKKTEARERLIAALFAQAKNEINANHCGEAIVHLKKILDYQPRSVGTLSNLGVCYARQGETSTARAWFQKALQIDPAYAPAQINLKRLND
ncbi:MAG: tetratricopeptide repeat protein, partial [Nitrospinales bacterium]